MVTDRDGLVALNCRAVGRDFDLQPIDASHRATNHVKETYGTASSLRECAVSSSAPAPAELSSLASSLDEISRRLRGMAEAAAPADGDDEDGIASDLWEIE